MATDRPSLTAVLPSFSQPQSQRLDPPLPETETGDNPILDQILTEEPRRGLFGLGSRRPATPGSVTPTDISSPESGSPSKADVKLTGELVAVVIGGAFVLAAAVVRMRKGRKLRQPTKTQLKNIGDPVGRIAGRHLNPDWLNDDLVDAIAAGSALAAYVAEGPLTVIDRPDPGLPADLNRETP